MYGADMSKSMEVSKHGRTQVLLVGMLDSIHMARWLNQFKDSSIDFYIFPSKKFKQIHPEMRRLSKNPNIKLLHVSRLRFLSGYFDFAKFEASKRFGLREKRHKALGRVVARRNFDYIHALELQGAGYLINRLKSDYLQRTHIIVTNWGSDIYHFMRFPTHETEIKSLLLKANSYSAECERDYKLARDLGFRGIELPCVPNGGGFDIAENFEDLTPPSTRRKILIKGYGGTFGRADLPISILENIAKEFPKYSFHFYSVTQDVQSLLEEMPLWLSKKVQITTVGNKLSHEKMIQEFSESRVYIGCSKSDGISTSFLEALTTGAYPIQTNTSCAVEWLKKGVIASVIDVDQISLLTQVRLALADDNLVNMASKRNWEISSVFLKKQFIANIAKHFYSSSHPIDKRS